MQVILNYHEARFFFEFWWGAARAQNSKKTSFFVCIDMVVVHVVSKRGGVCNGAKGQHSKRSSDVWLDCLVDSPKPRLAWLCRGLYP
jgi:hypothetical protein